LKIRLLESSEELKTGVVTGFREGLYIVKVGASTIRATSSHSFTVGDRVVVGRAGTQYVVIGKRKGTPREPKVVRADV